MNLKIKIMHALGYIIIHSKLISMYFLRIILSVYIYLYLRIFFNNYYIISVLNFYFVKFIDIRFMGLLIHFLMDPLFCILFYIFLMHVMCCCHLCMSKYGSQMGDLRGNNQFLNNYQHGSN